MCWPRWAGGLSAWSSGGSFYVALMQDFVLNLLFLQLLRLVAWALLFLLHTSLDYKWSFFWVTGHQCLCQCLETTFALSILPSFLPTTVTSQTFCHSHIKLENTTGICDSETSQSADDTTNNSECFQDYVGVCLNLLVGMAVHDCVSPTFLLYFVYLRQSIDLYVWYSSCIHRHVSASFGEPQWSRILTGRWSGEFCCSKLSSSQGSAVGCSCRFSVLRRIPAFWNPSDNES